MLTTPYHDSPAPLYLDEGHPKRNIKVKSSISVSRSSVLFCRDGVVFKKRPKDNF